MADDPEVSVDEAPHPASDEFDSQQNPAEKASPGTTTDAAATDPDLISTEPGGGPGLETEHVAAKDREAGSDL